MNSKDTASHTINENNGIAKTADLINAGMNRQNIKYLKSRNKIERIARGFYKNPDTHISDEIILQAIIPNFIYCTHSALFYYGYSDFVPRIKTIALPRSASRRIEALSPIPIEAHYVTNEIFEIGKVRIKINDTDCCIYDRERTICDIIKHRNKIDSETYGKALRAYATDNKKDLMTLDSYAKKLRVHNKVKEIMEVLL